MAQSKKLNQMIALAVDTFAMKGKFKRRQVVDDLMESGSAEIAGGGDNRDAHRLLLNQEICAYMSGPLPEFEKGILRLALPPAYRAAIDGARKFVVIGNGAKSEHCLFWLAAPDELRGEAELRNLMAKAIKRRSNLLHVTADFIEENGAKSLADLANKLDSARGETT